MILDNQYPQILKVLEEKKSFVICMPKTASADAQASAAGLYLALSKAGKQVTLVAEEQPQKEVDIIASEKIITDLQAQDGNTLVISFPYHEGAVDKITSEVEGDRLKVFVAPSQGAIRLEPKQVSFGYTGGIIDVIITIETARLENLGKIYTNNQEKFSGVEIINVDRRFNNGQYGTINVVEKQSSSVSEIILSIVSYLKIELDKDISTNLYTGLVYATNNFTSYSVNADTFDIASRLLRAGALKKPYVKKDTAFGHPGQFAPTTPQTSPFNQPSNPPINPDDDPYYDDGEDENFVDDSPPMTAPQPSLTNQSMSQPVNQDVIPQPSAMPQNGQQQQPNAQDNQGTPSDWLKPKIFKGSSNLV